MTRNKSIPIFLTAIIATAAHAGSGTRDVSKIPTDVHESLGAPIDQIGPLVTPAPAPLSFDRPSAAFSDGVSAQGATGEPAAASGEDGKGPPEKNATAAISQTELFAAGAGTDQRASGATATLAETRAEALAHQQFIDEALSDPDFRMAMSRIIFDHFRNGPWESQ